jgi:hypothetical protein
MNSKIIFAFLLASLTLTLFSGCKKHSEKFLGPEYVDVPDDFAVVADPLNSGAQLKAYTKTKLTGFPVGTTQSRLTGNRMKINIGTNYHYYVANFSSTARWTITISSWKTHAVKTITGLSDYIDETNSKWDGSSSNEYFFGNPYVDDSAQIKLSFIGTDIVVLDTIRIIGTKIYHQQTFNGISHYLVDDFDGGNTLGVFSSFYPDLMDAGGGNTGSNAYYPRKLQGDYSYHMYGKDINSNTYIGSCNTPTLNDFALGTFTVTDPRELFINMYVYGYGKQNTTVSVIAYENDADQALGVYNIHNPDGSITIINDKLIYYIPVTWTGWKLVSFRYSEFRKPGTGAGLGNNRLNPEKLCGLALELDSYPTQGYEVEALVDMVVVTENGIFQK